MKKFSKYLLIIILSLFIIPIVSVNVNVNAATLDVKTINASITNNKISVDGTVNDSNNNTNNENSNNINNNTTNTETSNKVDNTTNPKTGDNIILYGIMFTVALLGIIIMPIVNKRKNKKVRKH